MHQAPPSAKGVHFITLETTTGFVNLIVWPDVYQRYRQVIRGSRILIAEGEVQRKGEVINVLLRRAAPIPYSLTQTKDILLSKLLA